MTTIEGIVPVAPTAFTDGEELDLEGQQRIVDFLVDAEVDGICILANYSEQFSLTDEERHQVLTATLERAADRLPICVTTSHYSTKIAARRCRQAQELGASLVMLMPPFFGASMKVDEQGVVEYFKRVADGLEIPVMIQDAPMSTTPMTVDLMARIAREVPQVQYAKIEVPRTADKLRGLAEIAGQDLPGLFDGEEAVTLIPDFDAGARGTMTSSMIPDVLGTAARAHLRGDRAQAVEIWEDMLPLIQFENRQCGLLATKVLMKEGGILSSERTRAPFPAIHPTTRRQLVELAQRKDAFILRWAGERTGRTHIPNTTAAAGGSA